MALLVAATATNAAAPRFYSDDPLTREPETQDASSVAEWEIDLFIDLALNLFAHPGGPVGDVRAGEVNTIDEVPDSNWFTNRILTRPISADEAAKGPVSGDGPAPGRWTVTAPKGAGAAPGFTMRDAKGDLWFVTFDSDGNPEAATSAIMVANKIFWTLGYWQVENHVIKVHPVQLDIAETARFRQLSGKRRPLKRGDIDDVFKVSHRSADGSYRAVAGRAVAGKIIGGFRYYGTRPDDPNDIVPHQHRRSLRALKVFGAWTNLVDMKAGNTLDTVSTENDRAVVRHYLQDVGSTFGTGALGPREYDEGWEHLVEPGPAAKRMLLFGFPIRPWQTAKYTNNKAIGRFEGSAFDPAEWKPRVPAAALAHARGDDTFWAARRVAAFTDDMIRAVVKAGQYSDPAAEKLLGDVLIERRNKITAHYFKAVNPLLDFSLTADGRLRYRNAAVDAGVASAPTGGYRVTWLNFDNATGAATPLGTPVTASGLEAQAPAPLPTAGDGMVRVEVAAIGGADASWLVPVSAYFRRNNAGWQLVGFDRLPLGQ